MTFTALALVLSVASGGPPPGDEAAMEARAKRIDRAEKRWRAQGRAALPSLVKTACGVVKGDEDLADVAVGVLADAGADAARAVIAYKGPCAPFDGEVVAGIERERILAAIYCNTAAPYRDVKKADADALASWARAIRDGGDGGGGDNGGALAVAALASVLSRRGMAACDEQIFAPMMPMLLDAASTLTRTSLDNVSGTFSLSARTARDEIIVSALGASNDARALERLAALYDTGDLRMKLAVVDAAARVRNATKAGRTTAGPMAASPFDKLAFRMIDMLTRTRDDDARVRSLRALASLDAQLGAADADTVGDAVLVFLPRARASTWNGLGGGAQDGWALLGTRDGIALLARASVQPGTPAARALFGALSRPLDFGTRELAAKKLAEAPLAASLSKAQRACVDDTLHPPTTPTSATAPRTTSLSMTTTPTTPTAGALAGSSKAGANGWSANANAWGANAPGQMTTSLATPPSCAP